MGGPAPSSAARRSAPASGCWSGDGWRTDRSTDAEYADRLRRVREPWRSRLSAPSWCRDPANLFYLTGYNAWSFYTPQCLVVPADGLPHLFARAMDAAGAEYTATSPATTSTATPEELVHRPDVHPFDWIAAAIRALVPDGEPSRRRVRRAISSRHARISRWQRGLPANRLVDSRELVNWVRVVKSPAEVQQLRVAGTIAEHVMRTAFDAVRPGRRQCDVVAEIKAAQATGTPEHGGDYPAIVPMLPTGESAGTPHLTWSDRPFVRGEATTIELAGVIGRYHAPLARTVMLGEPPPAARRDREGDRRGDGGDAGGDPPRRRRPTPCTRRSTGHRPARPDQGVAHRLLDRHRLPARLGRAHRQPAAGETTEIAAGMAFHVILGMWMDGWGYEISEPVVVTDTGAERLTDLPQELTVRR